jgi:hypothetical protein
VSTPDRWRYLAVVVAAFVVGLALATKGRLLPRLGPMAPTCLSACWKGVPGDLLHMQVVDTRTGSTSTVDSILSAGRLVLLVEASWCPLCLEPLLVKVFSQELAEFSLRGVAVCYASAREEARRFLYGSAWGGQSYWASVPLPEAVEVHLQGVLRALVLVPERDHPCCWLFRCTSEERLRQAVRQILRKADRAPWEHVRP